MKKLSSFLSNLQNKHYLGAWLVYHIVIVVFFLLVFAFNRSSIGIDADLFNMFPRPFQEEGIRNADEKLTDTVAQNVFILVENEDFSAAKETAVKVHDKLKDSDNFQSVNLYSGFEDLTGITDFIYKYRWNLLDDASIEQINSSDEGTMAFAWNALELAYSPFTLLPLDNLETDPFMLTEIEARNLLSAVQNSGTAMSVKDGVLASMNDGKWYVMIRGILSDKGSAIASKNNGISEIYKVCGDYEKDGTAFVYSGTAFNSHQSSNNATKEITIITTVSMLVVILLLLFIFKNAKPLVFSIGSILISILTAVITTLAVFHKMHILTLVFGTSLIGSCIDYSLHFFTHWAGNPDLKSGKEIRNHLMAGLCEAIVSSVLCFAILLFAPFNMLKQMSVFSVSGLISSFLTTIAIYPYVKLPSDNRILPASKLIQPSNMKFKQRFGRIAITFVFVASIASIFICRNRFSIKNDLNKLYQMEGKLLEDKIKATQITKYGPSGWFIISGDTEDQALQTEYELSKLVDKIKEEDSGYISSSLFIPPVEKQLRSRQACEKLLSLASDQFDALGFDSSLTADLLADFNSTSNTWITLSGGDVPEYLLSSISTAWLGEIDGKYYTVLMPNLTKDSKPYKELAENIENVFYVNKMSDMAVDLDKLTFMIFQFFIIAYVIMFIILKIVFSWKQSFKIISIPLLIVLVTAAVFGIKGTDLEFFSVTGLILVFGLGIDYIIYMIQNERAVARENKTLEPFATLLSFATTVISFGALSLSTFQPVHLMGLSIFIGLTTAYLSSLFYDRSF